MKTIYSAADIEELAAQGVRELLIDDEVVITSVARDAASQLGIKFVTAAERGQGRPAPAAATPNAAKPKGCQHGPLSAPAAAAGLSANAAPSALVDDLIGAVKQLARQG